MWTIDGWYEQARAAAAANPEHHRAKAEHSLGVYFRAFPEMTREDIAKMLAKSNQERLDAVPSFTKYPELRGMRELLAAQRRGHQAGAGLDDAQAGMAADGLYYYHRNITSKRKVHTANCSAVYFGTSDHGPLYSSNLDTDINEPYTAPVWPVLNENLVCGGVSSGVFLDEKSPEVFPAPVYALVGRYCKNTADAVEMLVRYNHFWGPCNFLVADTNHDVAMFEKTACRVAVRRSADGFGYVTAMTQEDPELWKFVNDRRLQSLPERGLPNPCNDTRYWAAQDKRRGLMNRLMDEARKNPTVDKLRSIMQYREADGMVAGNGDVLFPGDAPIEHTIRTQIFCLSEGRALWWARDNAKNIPSWENRKEDVHFKNVWLWDKNATPAKSARREAVNA